MCGEISRKAVLIVTTSAIALVACEAPSDATLSRRLALHAREFALLFNEAAELGGRNPAGLDMEIVLSLARDDRFGPVLEALHVADVARTADECADAVLFRVFRGAPSRGYAYVHGTSCDFPEQPKGCPRFRPPAEVKVGPPIRGVGLCLYDQILRSDDHLRKKE